MGADVVLETDRLALRRFTEADAELLFELDSDPEVMRYIGPYALPDAEGYRDRIRSLEALSEEARPFEHVRAPGQHRFGPE